MWVADFFRDDARGSPRAFRSGGRFWTLALAPAQRWRKGRVMTTIPRFRSADRDEQTDVARMAPVRGELRKALVSLEREESGLKLRLEEISTRTAVLMGNEDGVYFEREPAEEKLLVEAELEMMNAYRRLKTLRSQRAVYTRLLDLVGSDDDPVGVIEQRILGSTLPSPQ
jgi:hypothetical protein